MAVAQLPHATTKPRRTLRERCPVDLVIKPISYQEWNQAEDDHASNSATVPSGDDEEKKTDLLPSPTFYLIEKSHLVETIEGLHIALVDDEANVSEMRTFEGERFSHVVRIRYAALPEGTPPSLSNWKRVEAPRNGPVQRLDIICPITSPTPCADRTVVGPRELRAARDFLALALPHGSETWWPKELRNDELEERNGQDERAGQDGTDDENNENIYCVSLAPRREPDYLLDRYSPPVMKPERVNMLIVAPTSRAVDVFAVLFCYIAFLENMSPEDVVVAGCPDEVWRKVVLGPWSMRYVDMIARCD